jgi:transposase
LPPDHLARTIARAVEQLDLQALVASYGGTGSPPYPPDLLLKVVLYELQQGRRRPAQWARDVREYEPLRWLAFGCEPSRARWYAFRDRLGPFLPAWQQQVLHVAQQRGLTDAARAALDGSLVAARASRHKLVNEATLTHRLRQLDQALAADAEAPAPPAAPAAPPPGAAGGAAPPAPPPPDPARPGWMAPTPAGRRRQQRRYRQAQAQLAQRQAHNRQRRPGKRKPADKVVLGLGDPEAVVSRDKLKVFRPLYNVQLLSDLDSPLVLAYGAFARPDDAATFRPLLERAGAWVGHQPRQVLTDSGYATGPNLAWAEAEQVQVYAPWQANDATAGRRARQPPPQIPKQAFRWRVELQTYECPQGHLLAKAGRTTYWQSGEKRVAQQYRCAPAYCQGCPRQAACTRTPASGRTISRNEYEDEIERLRARMATPAARALYRLRKQTVERGFADAKEHRELRRFSGHGLARAETELGLTVLVHNLLTLEKAQARRQTPAATTPTIESG